MSFRTCKRGAGVTLALSAHSQIMLHITDTSSAPVLLAQARAASGLSRTTLACFADVRLASLKAIEHGGRVTPELLMHLLRVAGYRPSIPLRRARAQVLECAAAAGLDEPLVVGSVARSEDHFESDADFLICTVDPDVPGNQPASWAQWKS